MSRRRLLDVYKRQTLAIVMMFVGGIKLSYLLVGMGSAGALLLIASKFVPVSYTHLRYAHGRDQRPERVERRQRVAGE